MIHSLRSQFNAAKTPPSLPPECRSVLQQFVNQHDGERREGDTICADEELENFWQEYVQGIPPKQGAFAGVLKELRPAIGDADLLTWWSSAIIPVINSTECNKAAQEDARTFTIELMVPDNGEKDSVNQISNRISRQLLEIYIAKTQPLEEDGEEGTAAENAQIASQVEGVLLAFARKRPKDVSGTTSFAWLPD